MNSDLILAATEPEVWAGVNPYVVGGTVLAVFLLAVGILIAFGAGREHS